MIRRCEHMFRSTGSLIACLFLVVSADCTLEGEPIPEDGIPGVIGSAETGEDEDNGGEDNGRLRYTGATTRMFHVASSISFGGGNSDKFVVGMAKTGTVIAASKIQRVMGAGGDIGSTAIHVMAEMATNDYLEVFFGNMTDTDDPTVYTMRNW